VVKKFKVVLISYQEARSGMNEFRGFNVKEGGSMEGGINSSNANHNISLCRRHSKITFFDSSVNCCDDCVTLYL